MSLTYNVHLWESILPILCAALTAILSYIGLRIKSIYEEYVNTKEKEKIVKNTVQYVEQVFTTLHGQEKLEKAKQTAINWLNDKNIPISDGELTILIESSVKALKGGFYGNNTEEN